MACIETGGGIFANCLFLLKTQISPPPPIKIVIAKKILPPANKKPSMLTECCSPDSFMSSSLCIVQVEKVKCSMKRWIFWHDFSFTPSSLRAVSAKLEVLRLLVLLTADFYLSKQEIATGELYVCTAGWTRPKCWTDPSDVTGSVSGKEIVNLKLHVVLIVFCITSNYKVCPSYTSSKFGRVLE